LEFRRVLFRSSVYLKGTTDGVVTNEYGFFSLTALEGNYTLVISYVGYEDILENIVLNSDKVLDFEMVELSTQLDEVIITADEPEQISIKKPQMSVSKLNATTIKQMPAVLG